MSHYIHHCYPEVAVDVFTEMDVSAAHIGVKRRFDIASFTDFRKHFFHQLLSFIQLRGTGLIKVIQLKMITFRTASLSELKNLLEVIHE